MGKAVPPPNERVVASTPSRRRIRAYVRGLAAPVLLWALLLGALVSAFQTRTRGGEEYDEAALREWVDEARVFRATLPELVRAYLRESDPALLAERAHELREQLAALADPTKMYQGQLPLFPTIYRLELVFATGRSPELPPVVWESGVPRPRQDVQVRRLDHAVLGPEDRRAVLRFEYQMHAFNRRQRDEQAAAARLRWVVGLAMAATALAFVWVYLAQERERSRERRRLEAQGKAEHAERLHQEAERKLLEQQLVVQEAERQALELRSQLYASIGVMAGSYAHNIKNLLVRPNDLLSRCLESGGLTPEKGPLIEEVRETLGTVTERLQQILRTVRRDPTRPEFARLDLNDIARPLVADWADLAREKWKLDLSADLADGPLWVRCDRSHLQQAAENLLFNARDATFEMRGRLRDDARRAGGLDEVGRRQALIDAAAWRGRATLRTYRASDRAVLEVRDNGVGMTEDVRRRCAEPHFSTKRGSALYEGQSTGMGLGLSFVAAILESHGGALDVESTPLQGAAFRLSLPAAEGEQAGQSR